MVTALTPCRSRLSGNRRRRFHRNRARRSGLALDQPQGLAQLSIDVRPDVRIILQELARVLASLADALALIAEPRAALLHDILRHALIQQVAFFGDAFAVDDVELRLT